jgi:predicted RNA binding protein YcfA (HicA-like mRNA interferase family)
MGRLKVLSATEAAKVPEKSGLREVRRSSSHIILLQTNGSTVTVPVPNHREIPVGRLLSIIRQSGLPRKLFES